MFSSFIVILAVLLFVQWEKKKRFNWKDLPKMALKLAVLVVIVQMVFRFTKDKLQITIPFVNRISEESLFIMQAFLFFFIY